MNLHPDLWSLWALKDFIFKKFDGGLRERETLIGRRPNFLSRLIYDYMRVPLIEVVFNVPTIFASAGSYYILF